MNQTVPLSLDQAHGIYDVLVTDVRAPAGDRDSFALEFTKPEPTNEWRFGGMLGFGGKFRLERMAVGCYREDETPERQAAMDRANAKLAALQQSWKLEAGEVAPPSISRPRP